LNHSKKEADVNPFEQLLRPDVLVALTALPIALQWTKKLFPAVDGTIAAVAAALGSVGVVLSVAWGQCSPICLALQCLYGWLYVEIVYLRVVEPMSTSTNPLIPDA
jgi:hypothetical protein